MVSFDASALPDSGQRYLCTPTELTSITVTARIYVWTVRSLLLSLPDSSMLACPLTGLIFSLHSVWRPSSEGGKRQIGRSESEGEAERAVRERMFFLFFFKKWKLKQRQYLRTKREVVKREWASLRKKDELRKKQTERERERKKQRYERGLSGLALKLFVVSGLSFKHTSQFKWLTVAIIFMVLQWDCVKWRESRM